jgi:hypothetical protein
MLMVNRSLSKTAPHVKNYRGTMVYNGLGIVWFVWLLGFWIGAHLLVAAGIEQPLWMSYLVPIFPLISGCCAFGLLDDWVGDNRYTGFRGHIRSLMHGKMTTGGLKFVGIGLLALFTAVSLYWSGPYSLLRIVLATCSIGLFANVMNLFDLRPGRANKVYLLVLIFAFAAVAFGGMLSIDLPNAVALLIAALGPIIAVWFYDIGEKGMIGDAGANSMGALLGYLFATALPLPILLPVVVLLFVLNLISERVSFSAVIANNALLRFLDGIGRKDV